MSGDPSDLAARVAGLEEAIQALGFAHGHHIGRLDEGARWSAALALRGAYRQLIAPGAGPPGLEGVEARAFSQNGEDGIILHLLSLTGGGGGHRFVEIGIESGRECNTANLAFNFGWSGTMIDRDPSGVAAARERYAAHPVQVLERHVTRENVDALVGEASGSGDPDLLSIDIDGNDLWVWDAVRSARPRLVVVEYNASFGPERSVSVPYDPDFDRFAHHPSGYHHGASLTALARVGDRKGYALAGCDSGGVNAFFIRADCAPAGFRAPTPPEAWRPLRERGETSAEEQFALIAHLPLDEVG